jgi:hypothetical protein
MRRARVLALVPSALLTCALLAGCGDDHRSSGTTTTAPSSAMSRDEFVSTWRSRHDEMFTSNVEGMGIDPERASDVYDEFLGCTYDAIADEPGLAERAVAPDAEQDEELDELLTERAADCQITYNDAMLALLDEITTTTTQP